MGQTAIIKVGFGGSLRYRLRPGTISPSFVDLSSTTHV